MKRKSKLSMLLAGLALAPLGATATSTATAQQVVSPSQDIVLSIGRGELISVPGQMTDVFVSNDAVADVQIKSQRQLYVFARAGGQATIYASNSAGDIIWSANVRVGNNIDSIDQMLALAMPRAQVNVATMGSNTVLLTGTVAAPEDAAEAERLIQAFLGDEANVISRLRTATPLQVNLQVKFAEVSRSLVRSLAGSITTYDASTGGFRGGVGTGRQLGAANQTYDFQNGPLGVGAGIQNPVLGAPVTDQFGNVLVDGEGNPIDVTGPGVDSSLAGTTLSGMGRLFGLDIIGALDLAETLGLVTTLSQPNLTALSGETATFLAGGEFPIPVSQGLGNVAIQYRNFGVSLAYTPTVLANGRISMRVRPEVSELSTQGAVELNGFQVPSLTTRRTETTVELGSGQSFMLAGLMSNNSQNALEKAPGLGDVPILGNLFRSRQFNRGETELVIIATPYLVKPVNERDIKLPTDGFHTANEFEQLLGFQEHSGVSGEQRPGPTAAEPSAPSPDISQFDPDAAMRAGSSKSNRVSKKSKKDKGTAETPTPGFSL
ncbi:MAG: type II and III secretion system protein family protein [Erythrobacter sp.]|uniref:type II and III secretion system protein family protein n=1 Tax=Erythrobacter sp. TaxID=1042 RepID=UPI0026372C20|nr:type II and III secretion system protein family protein [Erythrobacter sp.]MDJ0979857.1 type II and III secretion system protein family protein [Erythrobacter sp.]